MDTKINWETMAIRKDAHIDTDECTEGFNAYAYYNMRKAEKTAIDKANEGRDVWENAL